MTLTDRAAIDSSAEGWYESFDWQIGVWYELTGPAAFCANTAAHPNAQTATADGHWYARCRSATTGPSSSGARTTSCG